MIDKLIKRPVAVTMSIIAILILGAVALGMLPVSLMPNVAIPQVTVQVSLPGANAREVDLQVIKPLRSQLIQISSISELKCEAENGGGTLFMQFEHNSDIDLNFIEVNEKIDRALQNLPSEMERPKVIKASATDIPVFFIDITNNNSSVESFIELSRFAKEVLAKRIEQIEQVALVDISGVQGAQILIEPYNEKIRSLGISATELEGAINSNNVQLGNLTIQDGYYEWSVRFSSEINNLEDIANIPLNINNRIYLFKDLAKLSLVPISSTGLVRSNDSRAVTFAVIKQSDARMSQLKESLDKVIIDFNKEYPNLTFSVSRNQTELLDYSISNLRSNIIIGAMLAMLVIFFFLKDFRSPLLVMITIPLSLIVTLLLLYLLGITINIISLSGLILGVGMMVDNSIIVIDNIAQHWERGEELDVAIVKGTNEVVGPMLSSVLTTCSVFIPLIFLSGMAGALFYDQAMAVTVALLSSLVVAVLVIPVYFRLFYKKEREMGENKYLAKVQFNYVGIYEKALKKIFRHQKLAWVVFLSFIPLSVLLYNVIDKSKLPPLTHDDTVFLIDWNTPISIIESDKRTQELLKEVDEFILSSNSLVGKQDFILSHTEDIDKAGVMVYIKAKGADKVAELESRLSAKLTDKYPEASYEFKQATNIFNLIFSENEPPLIAMVKGKDGSVPNPDELNNILQQIKTELPEVYIEPIQWQEQILLVADQQMMALYGVDFNSLYALLSRATKESQVFSINSGSFSIPIIIGDNDAEQNNLLSLNITNKEGVDVPLTLLLKERKIRDLKSVISGKDGDYYPLEITANDRDIPKIEKTISHLAQESDSFNVTFAGAYYSGRAMIKELMLVLLISILLLFFILAAQFESLLQPLIILSGNCRPLWSTIFTMDLWRRIKFNVFNRYCCNVWNYNK